MKTRIAGALSACLLSFTAVPSLWAQPTKEEVRNDMQRVANWQIANYVGRRSDLNWENGVCLLGISKWAAFAEQEDNDMSYYEWLLALGEKHSWNVKNRRYHADDVVIGQCWMQLYDRFKREEMIAPAKKRADWVIANYPKTKLVLTPGDSTSQFRWSWCDALFMAPNLYVELYNRTGDKKYIKFMDKEFKATYKFLYDKEDSLFYRDCRYFPKYKREANGEKIFWGRGNGWVAGGLCEILRELPRGDKKYRPFYEKLFIEMCYRIKNLQGEDGFWRASMLDPGAYPSPETSSSGFFTYALAYGVNEGLLPREEFLPATLKAWKALTSAVEEDGKLGYVQPIGADPKKVTREMTEVYGPGAFLMAGLEIYKMAKDDAPTLLGMDRKRVMEIADMLPEKPEGIGVSYKNRAVWERLSQTPEAKEFLTKTAPDMAAGGMPPFVDSLYLDLNKSNYRLPGEIMMRARNNFVYYLTLAECMENRGRYVPAIEAGLIELCKQKPWSIPAHDRNLKNYHGTEYYADLFVTCGGNGIAQCVSMLDDKLSTAVKARVQCAFDEKLFRPMRRCLTTGKLWGWFTVTNNWNSVCLGGSAGAALALLPNKVDRAYFVAIAEKYSKYGMQGYSDDGYCSEGVGYFNYGFRAYVTMREEICRATQGRIDLFRDPKFVRIAGYGNGIQMAPGASPAYSDGRFGLSPDRFLIEYCQYAFGQRAKVSDDYPLPFKAENFSIYLIEQFPNPSWKMDLTPEIKEELKHIANPLRTVYDRSGIYILRPATGADSRLSVSFKGGHNAENHNHNDVGSYNVAIGAQVMAGDQGGPHSYPGDFFNREAYDKYKIKGSFGHPVPYVAGKAQLTGSKARGVVTDTEYSDARDVVSIDLSAAYDVGGLQLIRTFDYSREANGRFTVEDRFTAASAIPMETCITTRATWSQADKNTILLQEGEQQLRVRIEASGPFTISEEKISVNCPEYARIGISLKKPVANGYIRLTYLP